MVLIIYGQCYKRRGATPLMTSCERKAQQWSAAGNKGRDGRMPIVPAGFPLRSPADTTGHFPCRYTLSLASVYNHTLIPINLLLVPDGWRAGRGGLALGREAAEGENILTRNPKAPSDRLYQAWTSLYTEQMWSPTCFS